MWTPHNLSQSWEKRFRFTVGSVSFLTIGALAAFIGATAQLRNDFSGAVDSIPALHADLLARFDKGFDSLVLFITVLSAIKERADSSFISSFLLVSSVWRLRRRSHHGVGMFIPNVVFAGGR